MSEKKEKDSENIVSLDFLLGKTKQVISISPSFDICTGGGLVEGTWNILTSKEKFGKTTLSMYIASKCQLPENGGRKVFYDNIECRLKERDILSIPNLQKTQDKFEMITSTPAVVDDKGKVKEPAKILSAEDHLTLCEKVLKDNPGCCLIIDSESMLTSRAELDDGMDKMQRADGAKLLAKFARKVKDIVAVNNNIIILIRHMMSNPGGYGAPYKEKGSGAGSYQQDLRLTGVSEEKWEASGKIIGKILTWRLENGYLAGAIGGSKMKSFLRFGEGIDEVAEICTLAEELGLVSKKGAWYNFNDKKYCGYEEFVSGIKEDTDSQKQLRESIKEICGF